MPLKSYIVGDAKSGFEVPVARISISKEWLYIITDDYEGVAMLNAETLPLVIEALQKLQTAQGIVTEGGDAVAAPVSEA
jgi:hypothetical protein